MAVPSKMIFFDNFSTCRADMFDGFSYALFNLMMLKLLLCEWNVYLFISCYLLFGSLASNVGCRSMAFPILSGEINFPKNNNFGSSKQLTLFQLCLLASSLGAI